MSIERALRKVPGVREVHVNFGTEQASVSFDPEQVQTRAVIQKVRDAGYGVAGASIDIPVTGMTCANCAAAVERTLNKKVEGVQNASVNFATEKAHVEYVPGMITLEEIAAAIEKAGYGTVLPTESMDGEDAELAARNAEIRVQTRKFAVGVLFTLPLFLISMGRDFGLLGRRSPAGTAVIGVGRAVGRQLAPQEVAPEESRQRGLLFGRAQERGHVAQDPSLAGKLGHQAQIGRAHV